jgi:tight adherence protein B
VSAALLICLLSVAVSVRASTSTDVGSRIANHVPRMRHQVRRWWTMIAWVGIGIVALALVEGRLRSLVLAVSVVPVCVVVRSVVRDWRLRQERRARQVAVIEVCDALSAELRAGLPAIRALERACEGRPEWEPIVSAAALGGGVVSAMRLAAGKPGAEGLRAVAAGWEVAGSSGAAVAAVLERIAAGLRSDDDARAEVTACLGPVRATATMLAVLPVFGLALGSSMGARPIAFLLSTSAGAGCLVLGLALAAVGVWWVERLASAAEV